MTYAKNTLYFIRFSRLFKFFRAFRGLIRWFYAGFMLRAGYNHPTTQKPAPPKRGRFLNVLFDHRERLLCICYALAMRWLYSFYFNNVLFRRCDHLPLNEQFVPVRCI